MIYKARQQWITLILSAYIERFCRFILKRKEVLVKVELMIGIHLRDSSMKRCCTCTACLSYLNFISKVWILELHSMIQDMLFQLLLCSDLNLIIILGSDEIEIQRKSWLHFQIFTKMQPVGFIIDLHYKGASLSCRVHKRRQFIFELIIPKLFLQNPSWKLVITIRSSFIKVTKVSKRRRWYKLLITFQ